MQNLFLRGLNEFNVGVRCGTKETFHKGLVDIF